MEYTYRKLNDKPIKIEYAKRPDPVCKWGTKRGISKRREPSFVYNGYRYFSNDFISTHNNPHIDDRFPDFIHGYQSGNRYKPLFIEVIGTHAINIYEEVAGV